MIRELNYIFFFFSMLMKGMNKYILSLFMSIDAGILNLQKSAGSSLCDPSYIVLHGNYR